MTRDSCKADGVADTFLANLFSFQANSSARFSQKMCTHKNKHPSRKGLRESYNRCPRINHEIKCTMFINVLQM